MQRRWRDDLDKSLWRDDKRENGAVVFGGQAIDAARKALKADDGFAAAEALRTGRNASATFARVPAAGVAKAPAWRLQAADASKDGSSTTRSSRGPAIC